MEKKVYKLRIDPELRDLIPPLSEEERRMLEDSIVRDGCDTPLVVWNGVIVDGHNRYDICVKHSIPFACEERAFADKDAAMFWMLEHQLARRNLNAYQRSEMALKFEPMMRKKAAANQNTSTGGTEPQLCQNSVKAAVRTDSELGRLAGVSRDTIAKVKELDKKADDETKRDLRAGKVSIHRAYTDLVNREHAGETCICERCGQEKPLSDFRLPSNRRERSAICVECEKAERQSEQNEAAQQDSADAAGESGLMIRNGQLAHVPVDFKDDPSQYDHVVNLLRIASRAYIAAFETAIAQYHRSMISEEHNDFIHELIDRAADEAEEILERQLNAEGKEEN